MKTFERVVLVLITALVVLIFYVPIGHTDYAGDWRGGTYGADASRSLAGFIDDVVAGSRRTEPGFVSETSCSSRRSARISHGSPFRAWAIAAPSRSAGLTARAIP